MRMGLAMNHWPLGTRPVSPWRPARSKTPATLSIGLSTDSLRHSASGIAPAIVFITRVAGVVDSETRQTRGGLSSIVTVKARGPVQVIPISLTTAPLRALPK